MTQPNRPGLPVDDDGHECYECESCGCTEPEEVTGGWRCSKCHWWPPECTCYEVTGGHQPGCAFNGVRPGVTWGEGR